MRAFVLNPGIVRLTEPCPVRLDFDEPDLDDSDGGYSEYDETADTEDLDGTDLDNGEKIRDSARPWAATLSSSCEYS